MGLFFLGFFLASSDMFYIYFGIFLLSFFFLFISWPRRRVLPPEGKRKETAPTPPPKKKSWEIKKDFDIIGRRYMMQGRPPLQFRGGGERGKHTKYGT